MVVTTSDAEPYPPLPRIPASSGALIRDGQGRILILEPSYKDNWTIPGGVMEADGETPWEACRREAREECGLEVVKGRLVVVDFLRPRPDRAGGMRFLFDCGTLGEEVLGEVVVDRQEILRHRFSPPDTALELLSRPVSRRVAAALAGSRRLTYLEDGRPVK